MIHKIENYPLAGKLTDCKRVWQQLQKQTCDFTSDKSDILNTFLIKADPILQQQLYILTQLYLFKNSRALLPINWTNSQSINCKILELCTLKKIIPPLSAWKFLANDTRNINEDAWKKIWLAWCSAYSNKFQKNIKRKLPIFNVTWTSDFVRGFFLLAKACLYKNKISKLENKFFSFVKNISEIQPILRHVALPDCKMHLDFFFPKFNLAVEIQGAPHFLPFEFFGGVNTLARKNEADAKKRRLCKKLNLRLYEISELDDFQKFLKYLNNITKKINNEIH